MGHLTVVIGASAGGLSAAAALLQRMPPDCGIAFVLVQRPGPLRKTRLVDLLEPHCSMPAVEVTDGMPIQPNHVFVTPPNSVVSMAAGHLHLGMAVPRRGHRPIDQCLISLAEDHGRNAVCIVLGGMGSEATEGVRAVKARGGWILAQSDPESAAPNAAAGIARPESGFDLVLPIEDMPAALLRHRDHLAELDGLDPSDAAEAELLPFLPEITGLLRIHLGHDFSSYKPATMIRRVSHHVQALGFAAIGDYLQRLRGDAGFAQQLFQELLIGVSGFFRDPAVFEALERDVLPAILAAADRSRVLRVWVPACATGEEVYSLAMLFREALDAEAIGVRVQIFGSDIDGKAIDAARAGRYKAEALESVSPVRRERFFSREGEHYRIDAVLRALCGFSVHSLVKDPYFSRIDLISCRNLLIYLDHDTQGRVLRGLHRSLNADGFLLLGPSEGVSRCGQPFAAFDKQQRIFRKEHRPEGGVPAVAPSSMTGSPGRPPAALPPAEDAVAKAARLKMERYSPAYLVVDRANEIVCFSGGEARHYLEPAPGTASLNLFTLLHRALRPPVRAAIRKAFAGVAVPPETLWVETDVGTRCVALIAETLARSGTIGGKKGEDLCIVGFRELRAVEQPTPALSARQGEAERAEALEQELAAVKHELLETIEGMQTANEEMKASNEEFQAVNEELQAVNEELETTKEELQSSNDQVLATNEALLVKNQGLTQLNSDIRNFLDSIQIATIFLDSDLCIRSFTSGMTELFRLRDGDRGRPITDIAARLDYTDLKEDVARVLRRLTVVEREVQLADHGGFFLMRMRPYHTVQNVVDGVVITFVDITERKQSEASDVMLSVNRSLEQRVAERTGELEAVNRQLLDEINERRRVEREYHFLAHHDVLTGLPNRQMFRERVSETLAAAVEAGGPVAVLYLDLDRFKSVNDLFGHHFGDKLLQTAASRLRKCTRDTDIVARLGGDEFAVVMADVAGIDEAIALAERIIEALGEKVVIESQSFSVGASVGITISAADGTTPETLLRNADQALYSAKGQGGGIWRLFSAKMDAERIQRLALESDLRQALANDEFSLAYQPKIDLRSGEIAGFEALLRWRRHGHGTVLPGEFIHIAEQTGLVVAIGAWVLRQACADAIGWPERIGVSVNLSAIQVTGGTILTLTRDSLAETGLAARRLELEVTESVLLKDDAANLQTLHRLRGLGAKIAMDDFGTGYSSLSYLHRFPYSKIKIDHSFVDRLGKDEDALTIIRTIVALGEGLRMTITAEGVETAEQLAMLADLGCHEVQGYLIARPMPVADVLEFIAKPLPISLPRPQAEVA